MKWALQALLCTCLSAHAFLLPLSPRQSYASAMTPSAGSSHRVPTTVLQASFFKSLLGGGDDPQTLVRRGMEEFRQGNVDGSIELFDRALEMEPSLLPFLWQRGLSYYYADRYEEGAKQFRDDVAVNPNDTEESIWAFLCEAKLFGFEKARARMLKVGRDPRPYMRKAYELFEGEGSEAELEQVGNEGPAGPYFYSQLYLGLYAEARGDEETAKKHIVAAVASPYSASKDYMWYLARVHKDRRGW